MFFPDRVHQIVALGPLAMYLLLLGLINLGRRPFLTTGARDTAALGIGISGLVLAGPMELFMPEQAAANWPGFVWLLLLCFYSLCLTLAVLLMRPRLVVYNIRSEQLRPLLGTVVGQLDKEARWVGDCLVLPQLSVQLQIEQTDFLRTVQLISAGSLPEGQTYEAYAGWRRLELALRAALRGSSSTRNRHGYLFALTGLALVGLIAAYLTNDPQSVAQGFWQMLRLH
ncbi:MAG: hypothetical protein FJ295_05090 [Planctomycetes bacterium]|nr:hypothetical protein [Planctomycetota bacterium]